MRENWTVNYLALGHKILILAISTPDIYTFCESADKFLHLPNFQSISALNQPATREGPADKDQKYSESQTNAKLH